MLAAEALSPAPDAQTVQAASTAALPVANDNGNDPALLSLHTLKRQFESYLTIKSEEIEEAKIGRRYKHGVQWTSEQIEILRRRVQPPSMYNRIGRKIDGVVGIAEQQRQDPKAYPRNPQDQEGADVATAVVRYVMDRNEFASKKPNAFRQVLTSGIAGVEFRLVEGDEGDPDIEINAVSDEDFFYDPRSIAEGFTDTRFLGLAKWLDIDEAIELFPDQADTLESLLDTGGEFSLTSDRDSRWAMFDAKRIRMVEHWYRSRGKWYWAFYVGTTVLAEGVSPFKDQRGKTMPRFVMFSGMIDQDGDRYGLIRNLKSIQDEINQRVSYLLRLALTRRLIMEEGAVEDVQRAREEWARPDGVIVVRPGKQIKPDDTTAQVAEHTALLQLALNEMEGYLNVNPAALAGSNTKNLSGRAVNLLQGPGRAEMSLLFNHYRNWCIRVYRTAWNMAQQFWTSERWVRVTGDQKIAQFIQVNGLSLDNYGRPALVNAIGNLDVEIVMDEGPDVENQMQDAFDVLSQFPPGTVPMPILAKLMPIPGDIKEEWLSIINAPPDPSKLQAQQLELQQAGAKVEETQASAKQKTAAALSQLASAAHKGSEAHLNAASIFSGGLQQQAGVSPPAVNPGPPAPAPLMPQGAPIAPPVLPPVPGAVGIY